MIVVQKVSMNFPQSLLNGFDDLYFPIHRHLIEPVIRYAEVIIVFSLDFTYYVLIIAKKHIKLEST